MEKTLVIKGNGPASTAMRKKALDTINKLDDQALSRLGKMAETPKAVDFIKNSWDFLKSNLGIK